MNANFGSILFIGLPDITWAFKAKYVKQCEHFNLEVRKVRIIPNLLCAAAKFEMSLHNYYIFAIHIDWMS